MTYFNISVTTKRRRDNETSNLFHLHQNTLVEVWELIKVVWFHLYNQRHNIFAIYCSFPCNFVSPQVKRNLTFNMTDSVYELLHELQNDFPSIETHPAVVRGPPARSLYPSAPTRRAQPNVAAKADRPTDPPQNVRHRSTIRLDKIRKAFPS